MTNETKAPTRLAVWLAVGAAIAFVAASLFDLEGVWEWTVVALGTVLAIGAGIRLGVELVQRHRPRPPGSPTG